MKSFTVAAILAATASVIDAQGSQVVVHETLTSIVVVDIYPAVSTSTQYLTSLVTVLGCPPWELDCPVHHNSVAVVTLNTAIQTTVCPLTMTSSHISSFSTNVVSTSAPSSLPSILTTTTTWPSTITPSSFSPYSIPSSVWDSQSDISLGDPTGSLAGTKGDPAPTSLGSANLDPPPASVDSSALFSPSSAQVSGSSVVSEAIPTGAGSVTPVVSGSVSSAVSGGVSSAASSGISSAVSGGVSPAASNDVSSASSGSISSYTSGSASPAATNSVTSAPSTSRSSGATSVTGSVNSASASSIDTSGLLLPATDGFGATLSTMVSAHTNITTISGPSGVSVSISTGSITVLIGHNITSVIRNLLPVTYSANQSTVTFPKVTYTASATGNGTSNGTMATSSPTSLYTNSGTSAPVNMFSICLAIVALVLVF